MANSLAEVLIIAVALIVCWEMFVYARWRNGLYVLYLDYYNRKTHPRVPEAWRQVSTLYKIDFWLEWKMYTSPITSDMSDELQRKLRFQKRVVTFFYLPVLALFGIVLVTEAITFMTTHLA